MTADPRRAARRTRRHDPERRERIIAACLDVMTEHGVAGASHRRIAAAADVSLGSMTYHFTGIDEVLHEAFSRFTASMAERFESAMAEATGVEEARQAVIALIGDGVLSNRRDLVLTHELYTLAARDPAYRDLTNAWMRASRTALERHFDPVTARLLDALIEGLTIHRALDTEHQPDETARDAVDRITGAIR